MVPATLFVDASRTGQATQDGTSWATAFAHLTDALAAAQIDDSIWIARGTYRPDQSLANPAGSLDRLASFVAPHGTGLFGGFAGTEATLGQRPADPDPTTVNPATDSVLSGDLLGDDGPSFANYADNSRRVVLIGQGASVPLVGLTIRGANNDDINGFGGGVTNFGTLGLTNCTLTENLTQSFSGAGGAGLFNAQRAFVFGCTITNNVGANNGPGGGVFSGGGTELTLDRSTLVGNRSRVGGAAFLSGASSIFAVRNCTFSGGGGAIGNNELYNHFNAASVVNCTFATSGIVNEGSTPAVTTTVVWGGGIADNFGSASTVNYSVHPGGWGGAGGNNTGADPLLGPLGFYGGPTQTVPLLPGSSALDAGTAAGTPVTDQRGLGRVGATDIGAFESRGFVLTVAGGDGQSAVVNTAFADPLVIRVTANNPAEPVNGGRVTFTPPASGASAGLATPLATIAGGLAQTTATANGTTGSYNVIATTAGSINPVAIALTNVPENRPPVVEDQCFRVGLILALPGKVVGTVQATDPDPGDVLTYEIVGGNSTLLGAAFTIDPQTGTIRVANTLALGLGLVGGFDLVVRVTDADGLSDTAVIHIDVTLL